EPRMSGSAGEPTHAGDAGNPRSFQGRGGRGAAPGHRGGRAGQGPELDEGTGRSPRRHGWVRGPGSGGQGQGGPRQGARGRAGRGAGARPQTSEPPSPRTHEPPNPQERKRAGAEGGETPPLPLLPGAVHPRTYRNARFTIQKLPAATSAAAGIVM